MATLWSILPSAGGGHLSLPGVPSVASATTHSRRRPRAPTSRLHSAGIHRFRALHVPCDCGRSRRRQRDRRTCRHRRSRTSRWKPVQRRPRPVPVDDRAHRLVTRPQIIGTDLHLPECNVARPIAVAPTRRRLRNGVAARNDLASSPGNEGTKTRGSVMVRSVVARRRSELPGIYPALTCLGLTVLLVLLALGTARRHVWALTVIAGLLAIYSGSPPSRGFERATTVARVPRRQEPLGGGPGIPTTRAGRRDHVAAGPNPHVRLGAPASRRTLAASSWPFCCANPVPSAHGSPAHSGRRRLREACERSGCNRSGRRTSRACLIACLGICIRTTRQKPRTASSLPAFAAYMTAVCPRRPALRGGPHSREDPLLRGGHPVVRTP